MPTPTVELTWNCSEREVGGKKKQETVTGETSIRELVATTVCRTESVTDFLFPSVIDNRQTRKMLGTV